MECTYIEYMSAGGRFSEQGGQQEGGGALHGTVVILKSGSLAPGLGKKIPGHPGGRNLPYLQTSLSYLPHRFSYHNSTEIPRAGLGPVSQ